MITFRNIPSFPARTFIRAAPEHPRFRQYMTITLVIPVIPCPADIFMPPFADAPPHRKCQFAFT